MRWPVEALAEGAGVPEPALRLLLSVLFAFPVGIVYRCHVAKSPKATANLYLIAAGILILLFNYGLDTGHTLFAIAMSYVFTNFLRGTQLVVTTFVFHMGYLLIGYYYTSTDTYTIAWTMPHCVLVLRLIALSFDVSDGQRPVAELSVENKKNCLDRAPGLLELYAFALFPASLLIGPQFPFRRFARFANKEFHYEGNIRAGLQRGAIGVGYLLMNQLGTAYVSDEYLLSEEFGELYLVKRWLVLALWGKFTLYKYISMWLLCEGAAMCFGLTFVAFNEEKREADWTGCANIWLVRFENASRYQHYIDSFNMNTNYWTAEYVYKRLKFLNNRLVSQLVALMFLAVWHGFHSGYYVCFLMEFTIMYFEKGVQPYFLRHVHIQRFASTTVGTVVVWVALKLYTLVGLAFALAPLVLLTADKWWPLYQTTGYVGIIFFGPWSTWLVQKVLRATDEKRPPKVE